MTKHMKFWFDLLRVKQWVKNAFIFFPLIFSGKFFSMETAGNCAIAFFGFCLLSSGLYILNDFRDRHSDRLHPQKSHRPLARIEVNQWLVYFMVLTLIGLGLGVCSLVAPAIALLGIIYILVHLVYNFVTRTIVLLDVFFVAFGFQIRIWVGALASGVFPSVWLQLCVFLLALFLGFTKRRHELYTLKEKASEHRSVLAHYTSYLLDQIIIICSTLAVVFYGLYTISPEITQRIGNHAMVYSVAFVIYGIFRYLYLIHVHKLGGEPGEILATDFPSLANVLIWIAYISFLIYNPFPL